MQISRTRLSLRDYCLQYPTALVLDNADALLAQPEQVSEMLRELSAAVVVLTSSVYTPLLEVDLHVPLSELDEASVYALVRESPHLGEASVDEVAPWIYAHIGGNPLAVKIAMALMPYEEMEVIRARAAEETIGKVFDRLTEEARFYCCALSLLPSATIPELQSLWDRSGLHEALSDLTRFFLAEVTNGTYRLATSVVTYIGEQYASDSRIQALFRELLGSMSRQANRAVDVVEQVLIRKWVSTAVRREWIADFWKMGLAHGHFAQWCSILESTLPDLTPELWMAYGVCLRRAGRWELAHHALHRASYECGLKGDFLTQSDVLLEWATLARFQGDYATAVELLAQAERCNVRHDVEQTARIRYERSQIALDVRDGHSAMAWLEGLDETLDVDASRCEALLLLGEHENCRLAATKALAHKPIDCRVEASLYTLIARSYEAEGQWDVAVRYFSLALVILEPSEDISAIARAQANLAASLLACGHAQQAKVLLERAKSVFALLEDTVGYHAAIHNQRIMDIYQVGLT